MATPKSLERDPDARRVDVAALATRGTLLEGSTPLAGMPRLRDAADEPSAAVNWSARASQVARVGGEPRIVLELRAVVTVVRACQRCLEPLPIALAVERRLLFVRGEDEAERLDAESEDDVLALQPTLDLVELIEDELLLALPIVPRHERCIDLTRWDEPAEGASGGVAAPPASPFAALAGFKPRSGGSSH